MEDITGDGGVLKQVVRQGTGPIVPQGATVRCMYISPLVPTLLNKENFETLVVLFSGPVDLKLGYLMNYSLTLVCHSFPFLTEQMQKNLITCLKMT